MDFAYGCPGADSIVLYKHSWLSGSSAEIGMTVVTFPRNVGCGCYAAKSWCVFQLQHEPSDLQIPRRVLMFFPTKLRWHSLIVGDIQVGDVSPQQSRHLLVVHVIFYRIFFFNPERDELFLYPSPFLTSPNHSTNHGMFERMIEWWMWIMMISGLYIEYLPGLSAVLNLFDPGNPSEHARRLLFMPPFW